MHFATWLPGLLALYKEGSPVKLLSSEADLKAAPHTLVEFFAPWCGHCQRFAPVYEEFATVAKEELSSLSVAAVDCVAEEAVCKTYGVSSYPTLVLLPKGERYKGVKGVKELLAWVKGMTADKDDDGADDMVVEGRYGDDAGADGKLAPKAEQAKAPDGLAPLARRPVREGPVDASAVLAAARHSLTHMVAAALPTREGEGGELDEQGLLQLMQGCRRARPRLRATRAPPTHPPSRPTARPRVLAEATADVPRGVVARHRDEASAEGGAGGAGGAHEEEGDFLPTRAEMSWGDKKRRAILNWLGARARSTAGPALFSLGPSPAPLPPPRLAVAPCARGAHACLCPPGALERGLPREADRGATALAVGRLRRLLTEENLGLPTQGEWAKRLAQARCASSPNPRARAAPPQSEGRARTTAAATPHDAAAHAPARAGRASRRPRRAVSTTRAAARSAAAARATSAPPTTRTCRRTATSGC